MRKIAFYALFAALVPALSGHAARAEVLITEAEAKLPPSQDVGMTMRGLTRGPGIEQVSPSPDKKVSSPFSLKIKFDIRNRIPIDPSSIKLMYLVAKPVDLTDRIKKHITEDGIEIDQAEVPPGAYRLRLNLKDKQGRVGTAIIKLTVGGK